MAATRDALWATGHDETVEVNQRALIDKVLARYSGEFTVFRELLQNSDDAQSQAVEIRFETKRYLERKKGEGSDRRSDEYAAVQDAGVHHDDAMRAEAPSGGQRAYQGHRGQRQPYMADLEQDQASALPDLKTTPVHQWIFRNNGMLFRDEDWSRLKKIAEGNPDEEKIGAFGVGFYSLFSVTEEPFVTSGGQWMGFYWKDKKDQLFARRGELPGSDKPDSWTSFEMELREPAPIPTPFDFTRFLASSITFMTHLSEVSVYFDDKRLTKLTKSTGFPKELSIPKGLQNSTQRGYMTAKKVYARPLLISAEVMQWVYSAGSEKKRTAVQQAQKPASGAGGSFFSTLLSIVSSTSTSQRTAPPQVVEAPPPKVDLTKVNETSVSLSVYTADVDVKLDKKVAAELHRSTKKNPPAKLKYELIYTAKDEFDASEKEDAQQPSATGSIFQGLRADLEGTGSTRIFIGHSTAQTTGLGGHMATRFIPTVERESIDLMDRNVAIWNRELLHIGGFLSRCAYQLELDSVAEMWKGALSKDPDSEQNKDLRLWLQGRALHALRFFTFYPSTPSAAVSQMMEEAFFASGLRIGFPIISSTGVRHVDDIRLPDPIYKGFLKRLPIFPEEVISQADRMIKVMQGRGMLKSISFEDVLKELRSRPLSEPEMIACLEWWVKTWSRDATISLYEVRAQLLDAALLSTTDKDGKNERVVPLRTIKTFLNRKGSRIPQEGPLPPHLLPPSIGNSFEAGTLSSSFGWTELSTIDWLVHICSSMVVGHDAEHDLTLSPKWAERVLWVLTQTLPSMTRTEKERLVSMLGTTPCIPTSAGMKRPDQSYFPNVNIFNDLPVVTFSSGNNVKGHMANLLEFLGVRKHVELQLVFNRMIKTNEWTVADLAKYLASVRYNLSDEEWAKLRMTAVFSREEENVEAGQRRSRYRASQLYEPIDTHRQMGLAVIDWGTQHKWKPNTDEARFLYELGLQRYPSLDVIINLCTSPDANISALALNYLLDNMATRYNAYDPSSYAQKAYIPAIKEGKMVKGTPTEVYASKEWAEFGFLIISPHLKPDAATKLKLPHNPSSAKLVSFLRDCAPRSEEQGKTWFATLAGRIDFKPSEKEVLGRLPIVPVKGTTGELRFLPPMQCYFGGQGKETLRSKLFVFVDFGGPANSFLSACGTKPEPSVEEIARTLIADPVKFYKLAEGPTNFLYELRNLAFHVGSISNMTIARMKRARILLGSRRHSKVANDGGPAKLRDEKKKASGEEEEEDDDDDWELQYDLRRGDEIVVVDDANAFQVFGENLFIAPQEDQLEEFYIILGSRRLTQVVREDHEVTAEIRNTSIPQSLRRLILQRLPLFLHEHTHAKTKVSLNWLNSEKNFSIQVYGKITINKSLSFNDLKMSKREDASAVAQRDRDGRILLLVSGNAKLDLYEVAMSLNRFLFDSPKTNDALLFSTILSTDLRSLKRRGYNVDRILKQQEQEEARSRAQNAKLLSEMQSSTPAPTPPVPAAVATPNPVAPSLPPQSTRPPLEQNARSATLEKPVSKPLIPAPMTPKSSTTTLAPPTPVETDQAGQHLHRPSPLQKIRDRFSGILPSPRMPQPTLPNAISAMPGGWYPGPMGGYDPNKPQPTPMSEIERTVDSAVNACRPESGSFIRSRDMERQVREASQDQGCDMTEETFDWTRIGTMGGFPIYVAQDVPDQRTFLDEKNDQLARFIHIIINLAKVYKLPTSSLHIFFDLTGTRIAFNRRGSIFLNLRYYEAWHDADVTVNKVTEAYISWFLTLAHEIAHNLVGPHNAEHEFYFSAIAEKHIVQLAMLLLPPEANGSA